MAVDETQEQKPSRQKRPVYDVLRRMTLYSAPLEKASEIEAFVLLAEGVGAPSRGKAIDAALAKSGGFADPFGGFATVRHGEVVFEEREDPHAALIDDLVARMAELMPDADLAALREQARLAVEQNGAT